MTKHAFQFSLALLIFVLMGLSQAHAARVINFKGRKVLINLEQSSTAVGERFHAISELGQKTGTVEIKRIKGSKALALLLNGKVQKGSFLQPAVGAPEPMSSPIIDSNDQPSVRSSNKKMAVGGLVGLSFNNLAGNKIRVDGELISPKLSGMSFNATGLLDYNLSRQFSVRLLGGYETLKAESEGSTVYNIEMSYIGLGGLVRYHLMDGKFKVWTGIGVQLLIAMNKASNLVNVDDVKMNRVVPLALGADFELNASSFIPIQFEYNIWSSSSTISTSTMVIRAGYAYRF